MDVTHAYSSATRPLLLNAVLACASAPDAVSSSHVELGSGVKTPVQPCHDPRIVSALASIPIAPTGTAMASGFLVAGPLHGVVAQSESDLV